jgi:proton glutamate symport protein
MLVGALFGYEFPGVALNLRVLSQVFLKLVKTIIAPLIFATLVIGIAGQGDLRKVGRMGVRALAYFLIVTTIALVIGAVAINVSQAGSGISLPTQTNKEDLPPVREIKGSDIILNAVPENIAKSIAENQMLQIVLFSVLFGVALALLSESKRLPMYTWVESLAEVMFKFTNLVMYFAPIGVGAAIAYTVAHMGLGILVNLIKLLATLYLALAVFLFAVLLPIALFARVNLKRFIRTIAEPVSIAFATTSSDAALPRAIEQMEKYGVPRRIVSFVLPTGYTFNLAGTTLYLSLACIFVAQAAGIQLTFEQQVLMLLTLMLTTKGLAAVPRTSLVVLLGTAATFGIPLEPIFLIIGIDHVMDMARTAVNTIGNCLATVVVARWEGELAESTEALTPASVVQSESEFKAIPDGVIQSEP